MLYKVIVSKCLISLLYYLYTQAAVSFNAEDCLEAKFNLQRMASNEDNVVDAERLI